MKRKTLIAYVVTLLLGLILTSCTKDKVAEPAGTDSWTFVIFGDTRGDFDPAKHPPYNASTATGVSLLLPQIATKIASLKPEFVLHVGDLVCGDLYEDVILIGVPNVIAIPYADQFLAFKDAMSPVYNANIPLYMVRGNHEVSNSYGLIRGTDPALAAAYYQAFGQYMPQNYDGSFANQKGLTYSFNHKQVTVVAVDQYAQYVAPNPLPVPVWKPTNKWGTNFWGYHTIDQDWVSKQLQASTNPFKIVFAHEPVYEACSIPFSTVYATYQWSKELYFGPESFGGIARRQSFIDMMGANGAQLYAVGHLHNMSIGYVLDGAGHTIYQLTVGNGGAFPMQSVDITGNEAAIHDVRYELTKVGFTLATVNPTNNTMLLEYYVMDINDFTWSKESFTNQITGSSP
ncbi:MAG: metallophosphoesterase [Ignavibacteriales bacterium]|nr:metallophosphoesterase [Ignavibacteriales bacterium]